MAVFENPEKCYMYEHVIRLYKEFVCSVIDYKLLSMFVQHEVFKDKSNNVIEVLGTLLDYGQLSLQLFNDVLMKDFDDLKNDKRKKNKTLKDKVDQGIFITLSLPDDKELSYYTSIIDDKFSSYKWVKGCKYSIEQRGTVEEGNLGKGLHIHMLINTGQYKYKTKEDIISLMRRVTGLKSNFIDVRYKVGVAYSNAEKYMQGEKTDEKMDKVDGDKKYREIKGLKDLYILV